MEPNIIDDLRQHLRQWRWGALATQGTDGPEVSFVAFAADPDLAAFYLHLSDLAAHARNCRHDARVSLGISAPDEGADPQLTPRVSIQGRLLPITTADPAQSKARDCYLARFPKAKMRFEFADFHLYRLVPERYRYVAGFGLAFTLEPGQIAQ